MTTQDFSSHKGFETTVYATQEADLIFLYENFKSREVPIDFQAVGREYNITDQEARTHFAELEARVEQMKVQQGYF